MSNCCMRRPAKFHVDSAVRFLAIANIREGGVKRPPPPVKRGLSQIWWNHSDGECNFLSNVVFGFALTIIAPEVMEVFRNDVCQSRKTRKFRHFLALGLGATILTLAKNWVKWFRNHCWQAFERFFPLFSTTNRSRDNRGCSNTPPSSRWWKIWSASGARVNSYLEVFTLR